MNYFEKPTIKITIYCQKNEIHIEIFHINKHQSTKDTHTTNPRNKTRVRVDVTTRMWWVSVRTVLLVRTSELQRACVHSLSLRHSDPLGRHPARSGDIVIMLHTYLHYTNTHVIFPIPMMSILNPNSPSHRYKRKCHYHLNI